MIHPQSLNTRGMIPFCSLLNLFNYNSILCFCMYKHNIVSLHRQWDKIMASFRQYIIEQVMAYREGKIFTFKDLVFEPQKKACAAVVLSELTKKGILARAAKGVYFRPKVSLLGLKYRPLSYQEKLDFISKELGGYLSGPYMFNQMQLTEQVASVITIATPNPVRKFVKMNVNVNCIKSYIHKIDETDVYYLRLLDAVKFINDIPGTTPTDVYSRLMLHHFKNFQSKDLDKINQLALSYPPRVRKIMMDVCHDLGYTKGKNLLLGSINSNTHFKTTLNCN